MPIVNTVERLVPSWAPLSAADIEDLLARGPAKYQVQNIRERHHAIARLLGAGYKQTEVAEMLGCSAAGIGLLLDSPAFVGLLEEYRRKGDAFAMDLRRRVAGLAEEGLAVLHRRFLDTAAMQKVPLHHLSEVTSALLDRAGVGPVKSMSHTVHLSPEVIAGIKQGYAEDAEWTEVGEGGEDGAVALPAGEGSDQGAVEGR